MWEYMQRFGGAPADWAVGISKTPESRLFIDHGVNPHTDPWIYRQASSVAAARIIEAFFINQVGTEEDTGGGDEDSDCVYLYKKNLPDEP